MYREGGNVQTFVGGEYYVSAAPVVQTCPVPTYSSPIVRMTTRSAQLRVCAEEGVPGGTWRQCRNQGEVLRNKLRSPHRFVSGAGKTQFDRWAHTECDNDTYFRAWRHSPVCGVINYRCSDVQCVHLQNPETVG